MGRCGVLIGLYQEAEFGVDLLLAQPQKFKHFVLQLAVGDTHGAGGQLNAVENQVKGLGTHPGLVRIQVRQALLHRHGEGVVHGDPFAGFLVLFKEGHFRDPQEVPFALGNDVQLLGHHQAQSAQNRQCLGGFVRDDKDAVAFFCPQAGEQSVQLACF